MMGLKKIMATGLAAMMTLGMLGCSSDRIETSTAEKMQENEVEEEQDTKELAEAVTDAAETAEGEKLTVGFCVQDMTITYFMNVIAGLTDHAEQYNIEFEVHDAKSDAASQVTAIENYITKKVDCIVIIPVDPIVPESAVKEAEEAGIPVISWSEYIEGSSAFLTVDQYQYGFTTGETAGQWILDNMENQEDAKVLFVYVPEVEALAERGRGLMDGLESVAPNAEVVATQAGNTPEAGMSAVETTLQKYPDLNVVVCCNDSVALGACEALAAAGKDPSECCVCGCDGDGEALQKIKSGDFMVGTVDIGAYNQGEVFLQMARKVVEEGPQETRYWEMTAVTAENVDTYLK